MCIRDSLISGGVELKEKWQRTISSFTQNFDQDDPEFISLREAFMERFKEHGFVIDTIAKFNEETQALDEIIGRLQDLQKRNNVLLKKYKGDEKFARVHKRIREVNKQREDQGQKPMFSFFDEEIAAILNIIKEDVDAKVYDRNDILKKDAYFGRTVMALINGVCFIFRKSSRKWTITSSSKHAFHNNISTNITPLMALHKDYVRY